MVKSTICENHDRMAPWSVLMAALMASLAGSLNYYKVPPVMPILIDVFHINRATAGFLMSIFAIAGITLSIPAGLMLEKLGGRITGFIAACFIMAGCVIGALSTHVGQMLAGRFLEGVGLTFISVAAPMVIAFRFGTRKRPMAIGIFSTSFPVAAAVGLALTPILASRWGWQSVWWCGGLYALVALVFYHFFVRPLNARQQAAFDAQRRARGPLNKKAFFDVDAILMGFMFCSFGAQYSAFLTWTPTFLYNTVGTSLTYSSFIMSILPILGIISTLLTGWLTGRILHRRLMCAILMVVFAGLLPWVMVINPDYLMAYMAIVGFVGAMIPAFILALVADFSQQRKAGSAPQALVNMGQNMGMLLGPTLFGLFIDISGRWTASYILLLPVGILGALAALILRMRLHARIKAGIIPAGTR